ncbi:hypothetical protein CCR83_05190 [Rhodobacter veldkampii DSM 11550]|uniref:S-isoprenylcysteine methyltransferase n=1 Tax=Phaeovulum veldkampii DSM 11550 TaxID=1185920 RepID=A0A2T4JKM1_9RHOB|nr:isoprenylcysteine carboxylmethyltransferase family protein [Phaeovulum veldkampii]MBK5945860.1 hypothetical protein [Phaeovulum veldkampii DSM 11550]NCU21421.1 isoprenylcysteine carboxylmethyltransferase family protein [Candidatus Falkowbacteria bacterium]PTE18445.1 S-isoprenylcysteine methyltransferase [Phaeovulum veldkampii DSM 11550]TDQ59327.1 protein-S-isoprenylcysteine O-methyltransferase Ste14 [Phaeovulum veldkampii DSM 11550]
MLKDYIRDITRDLTTRHFIDLPPVWMMLFAALGWVVSRLWPIAVPGGAAIGGALVVAGLAVMGVAALQMIACKTTFIPHCAPGALVTNGAFRLSRNPIYVGDVLVLTGILIGADALIALPLVLAFMALITHRFIKPEEARIAAAFGDQWAAYAARTRRWL